ncbi:MAG: restriction endonuclease subunit S [Acidobacteria bacterium]|nr:restriction endonuclease subunit S [Acidobacteriota bacterium]
MGNPGTRPPAGWRWIALSDIAQLESGHTPSRRRPDYWDGDIPWISIKDAVDNHGRTVFGTHEYVSAEGLDNSSARLLPEGTVCLSRTASVGYVVVMGRPMATSQDFVNWVCGPDLDPAFLKYVLLAEREALLRFASGTTHQTIYYPEAKAFHLCLPQLDEQKRIVTVLGALDDKIELNRRMNATLEAMARALFQSWFVDFDPVRAKVDGQQPAGMDAATAALFPDHLEHTESSLLPMGWRFASISEVCAINASTLGPRDDLAVVEYVEISEVRRGNVERVVRYARGQEPSRARRRVRHGDTVISTVRPDRGSYFLVLNPPPERIVSTGFAVITPTQVPWSLIHAALTQPEVFLHLGQMADGGAYPAVRPEVIGAISIALPHGPEILDVFHRIAAPMFERTAVNREESRTLAALRDTLLPKLLSGELRVPEVLRAAEAGL